MRLTASEKAEIIRIVKRSELGVNRTLNHLGIHKRTFYNWYARWVDGGEQALEPKRKTRRQWNSIPQEVKNLAVESALEAPELSPRELAVKITDEQQVFISESSVYRILKANGLIERMEHALVSAADQFRDKTSFVHQMWQTDFTYLRVIGWGWYYLSTILDDYSRFIVHWELCKNMEHGDVERNVEAAMRKAGLSKSSAPKLLSDNGSCYIARDLGMFLRERFDISQVHGRPRHPQTQGKIERYHLSMKNVIKLNNYYCPSELERAIGEWVDYYNNHRYHESLDNLTPADVYYGRGGEILRRRREIKLETLKNRKINYYIYKNSDQEL